MTAKRPDAWKLGPGWNDTLLWYARAVIELKKKPITDRTSWRYLAAMHQFDRDHWIDLGLIDEDTELPDASDSDIAWNQCQHASFYFLPWHRGYLARFEQIIAATIESIDGPPGWKLPYWNYLDDTNPDARKIPEAFLLETLDDGVTVNPLFDVPRYGQTELGPDPEQQIDDINLDAMSEPDFTGTVSFGGSATPFSNPSLGRAGQMEINPHGTVHVLVGGARSQYDYGYLASFDTAGLDPLFWLHHCNLDRLWSAWMTRPGVAMESGKKWLDGPTPRHFAVPKVDGSGLETFTARDTLDGGKFWSDYENLYAGSGISPQTGASAIGVGQGVTAMAEPEVIGANDAMLSIGTQPVDTAVSIAPAAGTAVVAAMGPAAPAEAAPTRLFLMLENVRGVSAAGGIKVYINLPAGTPPGAPDYVAGSAALFGLGAATKVDGGHGGNGLTLTFDISALAQRLIAAGDFDPKHLRIKVVAAHDGGDDSPITIDRVSVLRA